LDYVLMEAQGGMTGQVILWEEYIQRRLKEMGFRWPGSILRCKAQGRGGGQQIGKTTRLKNSSAYIEHGYLRFPGRMHRYPNDKKIKFVVSNDGNIQKLVEQILNFPSGATDGVDTITQFLIYNEHRLFREGDNDPTNEVAGYQDTIRLGMKEALKALRKPQQTQETDEWSLLGV
ncbi:MAG TPA: hypothetical protein VFH61_09485, partial [Thermoleophilia bacterium]|nr:hypothetical protein [Thermoleophilia bacterium]